MAFFSVSGDLELTDNGREIKLVTGRDALLASLKNGAQIFRGYWRYDLQAGLPYFDDILVHAPKDTAIRTAFREYLLETPGVTAVNKLDLTFDRPSGTLTVEFTVVAEDIGEISDSFDYALSDFGGTL